MITAFVISVTTLVVYFSLAARIHSNMLLICAGHSFTVDLAFTALISVMAGITGSLTGLMISALTGLLISLSLFTIKWYYGSARIVRKLDPETNSKTWKLGLNVYKPTKQAPKIIQNLLNKIGAVQENKVAFA